MAFVEKRKKKHGDRTDGHLVKDAPSINRIMVNLYPNRCDNEVSSNVDLDITNLMNYINNRKMKDPNCQIKFFHCFIAALTRVLNEKRLLLRFIKKHKIYEKDEINIAFIAKRAFNEKAEETVVFYNPKKDDNVDSVTNFIVNEVKGARNLDEAKEKENDHTKVESLNKMSNFTIRFVSWFLKVLDKHGHPFKPALKADPSFATVLLANLGSIGSKSVYHHLNNYGTCSIMITIGKIEEREVKNKDGHIENRTFVDATATFDERIADGFYFIKATQLMQQYFDHPETLEKTFDEEVKF